VAGPVVGAATSSGDWTAAAAWRGIRIRGGVATAGPRRSNCSKTCRKCGSVARDAAAALGRIESRPPGRQIIVAVIIKDDTVLPVHRRNRRRPEVIFPGASSPATAIQAIEREVYEEVRPQVRAPYEIGQRVYRLTWHDPPLDAYPAHRDEEVVLLTRTAPAGQAPLP